MYSTFKAAATKRVFISFDYEHDKNYRYLLAALAKNPKFAIEFDDTTPSEIQSTDIGRIKAALTQKIGSPALSVIEAEK